MKNKNVRWNMTKEKQKELKQNKTYQITMSKN